MEEQKIMKRYVLIISILALFLLPYVSSASSLSLSPSSGTFSVGSTFDVVVLLDTKGKSINAMQVSLSFPADKLQVASPSTGKSIIDVWTVPPKYNNSAGTISFEGGIPGGIITSSGVITNITFRVRSTGEGIVKFKDESRVFLDDGFATDDLSQANNAFFSFRLPPPQGPIVVSETHPDQSRWYQNRNAVLSFGSESTGVEGFSYILNDVAITEPDNISEGIRQSVAYSDLDDGVYYFHIKSLRAGVWGGTTHFVIRVDATPPSEFSLDILPSKRTSSLSPVVQFSTTDQHSGLDYYEIKVEPLSRNALNAFEGEIPFFIEVTSPYIIPPITNGAYDVVVRAYDKAGNIQEISERLTITNFALSFIDGRGVKFGDFFVIPWFWFWILALIPLLIIAYLARRVYKWRRRLHEAHHNKELPHKVIKGFEKLNEYQSKYGAKAVAILFVLLSLFSFNAVSAQTRETAPPLINTVSRNISNKDIFYVGGKTNIGEGDVVLYVQNLETGETVSYNLVSNQDGEWFYRHNKFLPGGNYLLWVQSLVGETLSPPSPQERIQVEKTAIQFGSNRLSYEVIYLTLMIVLGVLFIGLLLFVIFHFYHGHKKYKEFQKEVRDAEKTIQEGFAVLKTDIEAELSLIHKVKLNEQLTDEQREKERRLLNDLEEVRKHIGEEVWKIQSNPW